MSSSLNLKPDLPIMIIQASLFLVNMFVVKRLILQPYLSLKLSREKVTGGSQVEAQDLLAKSASLDQEVAGKLRDAHKAAALTREGLKTAALSKRSEILAAAELTAKTEQQELRIAIVNNLAEERLKREGNIMSIANELIAKATL
ncbi:MAG: hypothetical protein NTV34_17455 [Proteobacteria bacterium]|nr:hypothetical protein [Pseudomonadota bacterium]